MANNQFEQRQNSHWYPQLPDGYDGYERNRQERPVPAPTRPNSQPQQNWSPGYNQPTQQQFGGMNRFPFPFGGNFPGTPSWPGSGSQHPQMRPPNANQPPQSAPPNWTPEYPSFQTFAVDPGAIAGCMFRFTYVWLSRRRGFWFFPVFVGPTSVAGYQWNSRRNRWEYTGLDLANINSFTCI